MEQQQPTSESQRDAIVAWLEQDDNFLRVTAFSAPSRPYLCRDLLEAEQVENEALSDLAASVNGASPRSRWDGKHAKQMLSHYLMEFKSTAREASKPGFMLSKTDEVFGIKTVEDMLDSMCPHFVRLQTLHDPMRGSNSRERNKEKVLAKHPLQSKITRTSQLRQDKVIPSEETAHQSIQKGARTEPDQHQQDKTDENSVEKGKGSMTRNRPSLQQRSANEQGGEATGTQQGNEKSSPNESTQRTLQKSEKNRAVSAKHKQQQQQQKKKKEEGKERGVKMPEFIELTSDEEEEDDELPFVRSRATVKVGRRLKRSGSLKSTNSDEDESPLLRWKLRRVEANPGKPTRTDAHQTPPRTTGKSTRAEVNRTPPRTTRSSASEKSPVSTRKHGVNTPSRGKKSPRGARKPAQKDAQTLRPAKPASMTTCTAPGSAQATEAINVVSAPTPVVKSPESGQEPVPRPAQAANTTTSDQQQGKEVAATNTDMSPSMVPAPAPPQRATEASAAPELGARSQASDALRSAIAQVVSQRQELLNSRRGRRQIRQLDVSDSDFAPSNDEEEEEDAKVDTPQKDQRRRNAPAANNARRHLDAQDPPTATNTTGAHSAAKGFVKPRKRSDQGAPAVSRASGASRSSDRPKAMLMAGHVPPLLNLPRTFSGDTDINRKRAFLCAKKLAFEQFKWIRENELQQQEVELLRREMETREALAQKEIELQRMNIRADIIQRMVRTGASVEDIAERLTLL